MSTVDATKKLRDFYNQTPNAPIYQKEFGFYSLDRWKKEGHIDDNTDLNKLFGFDAPGSISLGQLGWCEAAFSPAFEEVILEDRGEHEVVQDYAGRAVLYFKNRRSGFMPEYIDHPVKDMKTWEENVKWRLNPNDPERFKTLQTRMTEAKQKADNNFWITQGLIGPYMYLRSLIGPEDLLYMFHDDPDLIHDCMKSWLELADKVTTAHQEHVSFDEVFFGEDICYNHGCLISPDMVREFLFPYYQQLLTNIKSRQLDKSRKMHIQIDTDGFSIPVIDLYKEIGMTYMSPFEVASNCDVVEVRKNYPDLLISGGFDKRIISSGKEAIDREIDRIMPFMRKHGGYLPTCDHGVPEEVSFENYIHFRKRMLEYSI